MSDFLIQRICSARSTSVSEVPTRQHGDDLLAVGSEHHGNVGPHDPRAPTENVPKESDPLPASAETMRASYTVEAAGFAVVCLRRARSCRSALMAARGD